MGDSERNVKFAHFIIKQFHKTNFILIVADGKGELARKQTSMDTFASLMTCIFQEGVRFFTIMKYQIERTKRNFPAMWECGGGRTSGGEAMVISSPEGEKKTAIYIPHGGHLCNGNHALIPVEINDIVVRDSHSHGDHITTIYRITDIQEKEAVLEEINEFSRGEWDTDFEEKYVEVVSAAQRKSESYHCRDVYFAKIVNK